MALMPQSLKVRLITTLSFRCMLTGVDYIKIVSISRPALIMYRKLRSRRCTKTIDKTKPYHPKFITLHQLLPGGHGMHAQCMCITGNFWDRWELAYGHIWTFRCLDLPYRGPLYFLDADMLPDRNYRVLNVLRTLPRMSNTLMSL